MAGIDKILNEIKSDAEKEAAEIIAEAEKAAEAAKSKAQAKCDEYTSVSDEKLAKRLDDEAKKTQSQCEQIEKLVLLKTKQEIIEEVLNKAKNKILNQDADKYFESLLVLLDKYALPEKGILFLNSKDLARVPDDFETLANKKDKKNGGMLDISKDTVDIDGGFILKYGNIEINASLDAIFDENRDELVDTVNGILF